MLQWTEKKEKDTSPHRLVNYVIERNIAYSGLRLHLFDAALLGDEEIRSKLIHRYDEFQKLISSKIAERTDKVSADYFTWLILTVSDGIIIQNSLKNDAFDTQQFLKQSAEYIKKFEIFTKHNRSLCFINGGFHFEFFIKSITDKYILIAKKVKL